MNGAGHSLAAAHRHRNGFLFGLAAYGLWGLMPVYFKLLAGISAVDIVAHRILFPLAAGWLLARYVGGAAIFGHGQADFALLVAVLLYGERFTIAHAIAFAATWAALALYITALVRKPRLPQAPE